MKGILEGRLSRSVIAERDRIVEVGYACLLVSVVKGAIFRAGFKKNETSAWVRVGSAMEEVLCKKVLILYV